MQFHYTTLDYIDTCIKRICVIVSVCNEAFIDAFSIDKF